LTIKKEILTRTLCMKCGPIQHGASEGVSICFGKYIELFFGAGICAREAKQLEEKSAALGITWLRAQFSAKRLNGRAQLPGLVERDCIHK
jgi:hypothetical protein